jgi:hypothetical protein
MQKQALGQKDKRSLIVKKSIKKLLKLFSCGLTSLSFRRNIISLVLVLVCNLHLELGKCKLDELGLFEFSQTMKNMSLG